MDIATMTQFFKCCSIIKSGGIPKGHLIIVPSADSHSATTLLSGISLYNRVNNIIIRIFFMLIIYKTKKPL